ncbi:hypothetical protein HR12_14440 [Microbacterium sp. SUBG005]|nr:hypothetical protein HR12_14440 [Microbacterium sp. SUBG005]
MRHVRFAYHGRLIGPENTGLLTANALAVRAQPVGVIQRDAGDDGDIRIHHIGGIQTPAQPHFQDHHVQLRLLKQPQRRQGAVFEIG